jgi:hypothetical protein
MCQGPQNGIQDSIQFLGEVLGQKAQDKEAPLLQESVLLTIPPVGLGIGQVLRPVKLDHYPCVGTQKVHLHMAQAVERDRQLLV